jgi:replicative DNA helicase
MQLGDISSLERAILWAGLQDHAVVPTLLAMQVGRQDFQSDKRLEVLWRAMAAVHLRGQRVDPHSVTAFLREHNAMTHAGGDEFIVDLLTEMILSMPLSAYAEGWVQSLRRLRMATDHPDATRQRTQFDAARERMNVTPEKMLRYPIKTLDDLRGGWAPSEVDFCAAASGAGKTTMLSTLSRKWVGEGRRVFYAGFELPPEVLRLQWAAHEAGFLPADIVSGEYHHWPNRLDVHDRVMAALAKQEERIDLLRCADADHVTVDGLRKMGEQASRWGCDVFIIDHIDHVDGNADLHQQSRQVTSQILSIAKATGVRFLVATQLNQQGLAQDRLRSHRPVREEFIKQGGHKKEIATFMFGLSRAIKSDVTKEDLKRVRDGASEVSVIEEPYAAQVNVMKHRWYGDRLGKVRLLSWERGEYTEYLSAEERKPSRRVLVRNDLAPFGEPTGEPVLGLAVSG